MYNMSMNLLKEIDYYIQNGYTTIQDGKTDKIGLNVLYNLSGGNNDRRLDGKRIKIDVCGYVDYSSMINNTGLADIYVPFISRSYRNGFRIAGAKVLLDGNI